MYRTKSSDEKFENLEEFIDYFNQGGELEFIYKKTKYGIFPIQGKLHFCEVGYEDKDIIFTNMNDLLNHKISCDYIKDIVTILHPTFRCF